MAKASGQQHGATSSGNRLELPPLPAKASGYISRRVDLHLTAQQATALRLLTEGYHSSGDKQHNGRNVTSSADALRLMLERIAKIAGIPEVQTPQTAR